VVQQDVPAIFIHIKPILISSSQARVEPDKRYLPESVIDYISTHGLYIDNQIKPLMSPQRYQHTLRVAKLAQVLAQTNNPKLALKAYIAAMCHDVAKEFSDEQTKKIVGH
jgi:HD-GYP domain-containing protein (c-di-GMP phosphodiesterase class II)